MGAEKSTLTERVVESLRFDPEGPPRQVRWDGKLPGFGCRVTPAGGRQYVLLYRFNGRPRLMSLGPVSHFQSVRDARQRAEELLLDLRRDGVDPLSTRERLSSAATVSELWERYLREHIARQSPHTRKAVTSIGKRHLLPALGQLKPQQLSPADLVRLHDRVTQAGGKVIANRTVQRFRGFVSWTAERDDSLFSLEFRDRIRRVKLHREHPRTHHLDAGQMRALAIALAHEPSPWVRVFVMLLMLTGARQGELRRLRWEDVDLERRVATIGRTKNGKALYLQLPPAGAELLRELPVIAGSPWVFPGRPTSEPMTEPRLQYKAALRAAGLSDKTTFHDLRRSYGTALARQGATAELVARALNNTTDVAGRVYVQLAMEDVRGMAERHALSVLPVPA